MRHAAALMLLVVACVHLLPVVGVLGAARLEILYGVPIAGPDSELPLPAEAVTVSGAFGQVAGTSSSEAGGPNSRMFHALTSTRQ